MPSAGPAVAQDQLDATFTALADPTRRAIVARLAQGDATVNELAGFAPKFTLSAAVRLLPDKVTLVPPDSGPWVGATALSNGADT